MPARKYHGHHAHRYIDWVPSEPGMADLGGLQISQDHNPRKCAPPLPSSPQLLLGTRVTELGQFVWKWGGPTAPHTLPPGGDPGQSPCLARDPCPPVSA